MEESSGPFWEQGGIRWAAGPCGSSWLRDEGVSVPGSTFLELSWGPESLGAEHTSNWQVEYH